MLRITVCGSFGFGNTGDEAVPLAIENLAQSQGLEVGIDIVGRFSKPSIPEVIGLGSQDAVRRRALQGHPLLVTGGGIIEPKQQSTLIRCAPLLKKHFASRRVLWASSVEPGIHYSWIMRSKIKRLLDHCESVSTRDVLSQRNLRLLFPNLAVECVGDSVLWLQADPSWPIGIPRWDRFIVVVLAPRWINEIEWHQWITVELQKLALKLDSKILFVPLSCSFDDDRTEHQLIANMLSCLPHAPEAFCIDSILTPRQISTILKKAQLTVSMRLHGCVMSYAQETPFVAIAYHHKIVGFAETVGWQRFVLPRTLPSLHGVNEYGFQFSVTGLQSCSLVSTAQDALAFADFRSLPILKVRLVESFNEAIGISVL